jgi:hypothetical protein
MKKYFFFYGLFLSTCIHLHAQVNVSFSAPAWGPKVTTEEYYYLPDVNSYYDIRKSQYIYVDKGAWIRAKSLPPRFQNYNPKTGHVVIINDYHGQSPYIHYKKHKVKYFGNGNNGRGNGKPHGHYGKAKDHENQGNGKGNQNKKGK